MISTKNNAMVATCDICGEETEEFYSFKQLVAAIKAIGWVIDKGDDVYVHYCPACSEYK